ncbi:unnamed protein product [Haemonchus placei]|uniref:UPAR/Ly6 domain-containing protein n=1 Tax=Haemonchus placei TaxID=6290 RepID=A0A0N4X132_HAEPC|nr:unnamed protein product [Haemonchus placei]
MSDYFSWILMFTLVTFGFAFECYICNPKKGPTCPGGTKSCSMAVFGSGEQVRVRKFCTSTGSTLYHYLLLFPGASFCQNMNVVTIFQTPSLLCVCTSPLCNAGHFARVIENTMLNYLPRQLLSPPREEKKIASNSVHDHPDFDLAKQLADAGF